MGNKSDSHMRIDPDGKRLQIDDLIIIPNNLHSPPEGGSALKSLAQIASRYQSGSNSTGPPQEGSSPKKPRLDDVKTAATSLQSASSALPPTSAMNLGHRGADVASLLGMSTSQQSLFSVFPPGLMTGSWPPSASNPASKPSTNTTNSTSTKLSTSAGSNSSTMNSALALAAATAAAAGLSNFQLSQDPTKMGPDGYSQLLQLYEKHLKTAATAAAATTTPAPPTLKQPTTGLNGSKKEQVQSALSAKDKDRQKVSKPPPETKRPPRLMQTPCAFVQTNHIYTNPMVELAKAKEAVAAASANAAARDKLPMGAGTIETQLKRGAHSSSILDLSSHRRAPKSEPTPGLLNLKKESALLAHPHSSASSINLMSPSMKREGLSSSSMSHPLGFSGSASSSRSSPSLPRASPAPGGSPFTTSHSPLSTGQDKSRSSPWHTPVSQGGSQKPAIPVSPVIRDTEAGKKDSLSSFQSALFGLSYPSTTTSTSTAMSMAGLAASTYSLSPSASSLVAAQQSFAAAAAANPYLALMSMGGLPQVPTLYVFVILV